MEIIYHQWKHGEKKIGGGGGGIFKKQTILILNLRMSKTNEL
jgi:hypothetical protein